MKKIQYVFQRYEKKYLLNKKQYERLCEMIKPYMQEDTYGKHTICNLYYDTDQFDLIRASIDKPPYKEKLRLRSYGVPKMEDTVFLELKKKVQGIVYKRRISMSCQKALSFINSSQEIKNKDQIMKEIDYFLQYYPIKEKVYIAYDRIAYFWKFQADFRITFDFHIRWRTHQLGLDYGDYGQYLLDEDQVLMEIKMPTAMPLWLSKALTELQIYPTSFSKYGMCYKHNLYKQVLKDIHE